MGKRFNPVTPYDDRFGLIDLQPDATASIKGRNVVIPAPDRCASQRDSYASFNPNEAIGRNTRIILDLSRDVRAIGQTIPTRP